MRNVECLLQRIADVRDRGLDLAGRVDVFVENIAIVKLLVRIVGFERDDSVNRLRHTQPVAARRDGSVVAKNRVLARAAGNPVVVRPADQIVILPVAKQRVAALLTVDEVIADSPWISSAAPRSEVATEGW